MSSYHMAKLSLLAYHIYGRACFIADLLYLNQSEVIRALEEGKDYFISILYAFMVNIPLLPQSHTLFAFCEENGKKRDLRAYVTT